MSEHTKGPWEVRNEEALYPGGIGLQGEDECDICPDVYGKDKEEAQANARLIAAAPAMYEALMDIFKFGLCPEPKTLKGWEQRHSHIDDLARAAIAKTEGR